MSPLLVMTIALVLNTIGFANYAAVLPALMADTGFSEAQAGLAGGAFFLSYAVASPVFAALTDTLAPRRLYALGCSLGVAGGVLFPLLSTSYEALVLTRIASGIGMAGIYMPGLRLLIESIPADRQARAVGIHVSALTLGLSASFAVSGCAQSLLGWPSAFMAAAVCAGLAMMLVVATMTSPAMRKVSESLPARLKSVARGRGIGWMLLAVAGNSWEGMAFRTWWVALLTFAVTSPSNIHFSGLNLALVTAFTGLLAMPLSSFVAHRAAQGQRHRVIAIAAGLSVIAGVVLALCLDMPFPVIFAVSVIYICAIFSDAGSLPPAMLARVSVSDRGAALALMSLSANGAAWAGVTICGFLLEFSGGRGTIFAWQVAILAMAAGSLMTVIGMLILERQERQSLSD